MEKRLFTISILGLLLFSGLVIAQNNYESSNKYSETQLKEIQNQFQNQYKFNCTGECTYSEENNQLNLQVRTQKRFLFWDVTSEENYVLNEQGEIIQTKYNFWSRLLNRNKING